MDKHFIRNGLIFASTVLLFFLIGNIMKKRILLFLFSFVVLCSYSQAVDDFVGTWRYTSNDTVFTIVLKRGKYTNSYYDNITSKKTYIFGGYSLQVNGIMIDNYTSVNDTFDWNLGSNPSLQHIYINAIKKYGRMDKYGFIFYDQRKRHFDGKGISGGNLTLLTPNRLKWEIDEEAGIWFEIEGCEDCPEVSPIGFSVPNNVVLTKVLQ
ncbi:MAG: hypothetical protein E7095_07525 [Bacteroides sp.]|nr:hypothetical protein [Bacteroides sp.]